MASETQDRPLHTLAKLVAPRRVVLNPVLADMSVIDAADDARHVFYTPVAQQIEERLPLMIAGASGVFLLTAWLLSVLGGPLPLKHLCTLLAFAIAGVPAMSSVWASLREFRIDIDTLMLLAALLAAWIGSPFEGALLLFLFALSGAMEEYALGRTHDAINAMRNLSPQEALLLEDGQTRRVPLREIPIGATMLVRPGDRVPLDGTITEGHSAIDESAITGESVPHERGPGDEVFAGTQNTNGRLVVEVSKLSGDTALARIVELVSEAKRNPTHVQRLIDRIGPSYSVGVMVASCAVAVVGSTIVGLPAEAAIQRAIALLIVASPCALIIATPVAYLSAIAAAARRGVLIKGGAHLETLAKAATIVFDKTGTLTTGHVRLVDMMPPDGSDETQALSLAAALEASSSHPLAEAVMERARQRELHLPDVDAFESTSGQSVAGMVDGRRVWVGRPENALERLSDDNTRSEFLERVDGFRGRGKTVSALLIEGRPGLLVFEDTIRETARDCVETLRKQGIAHLQMLTGDHQRVADGVSRELGLDAYHAALQPEDKQNAAARLKAEHGTLVMVGDGVNDAPALIEADTGIAVAGIGADVALQAADIVLMKDRIDTVAWLHRHAKRTAAIVKQNLTFALAVIALLSLFSVFSPVRLPLPLAVIGHEGSTVLVALNALRLLRGP